MQTIGIWGLREEARELWDYFVCNEVIYFSEPFKGNFELAQVLAKQYLDGDLWFEVHWTFIKVDHREMHFNCIIERSPRDEEILPSGKWESDIERIGIHGNRPVFVHRPELIKLPEGVILKGIPSEVRLKRINLSCHCGWEESPLEFVNVVSDLSDGRGYRGICP